MKKHIKFYYLLQKIDSALCTKKEVNNLTDIINAIIKGFGFYAKKSAVRLADEEENTVVENKDVFRTGEVLIFHNKSDTYKTPTELKEMYNGNYFEEREKNITNYETGICKKAFKIAIVGEDSGGQVLWLKEKGFTNVQTFDNNQDALSKIDSSFCLILVEYHMKDAQTAIQLYREITENRLEIPIVITRGHTEFEYNLVKKHNKPNLAILPPTCTTRLFEEIINRIYIKFLDKLALV